MERRINLKIGCVRFAWCPWFGFSRWHNFLEVLSGRVSTRLEVDHAVDLELTFESSSPLVFRTQKF